MDKLNFYDMQHVAAEDMGQIYLDAESFAVQHLKDFHSTKTQFVLGSAIYGPSSLQVLSTTYPSLTVEVSGGVGYDAWQRVEITSTESLTIANIPPNSGGGLIITRIDLIYINKTDIDAFPFTLDFIDANRNIFQETKNTRNLGSYELIQLQGTYNIGGATPPAIPAGVIPLAYIYLRDNTNKIYNADTSSLNEGYIVDARTVVYATTI